MARPKSVVPRSCLLCKVTMPRHIKPPPHYAEGLCEKHYRQKLRKLPLCKAAGCRTRLKPKQSRQGYCRMHEPLLLQEPIRKPEAIARTLEKFLAGITPSREGLDGLFGCWPWTGRRNKTLPGPDGKVPAGYGLLSIGNHDWLAHRYSYNNFVGGHRQNRTLDHVCGNSLCVRPDHLMPMTERRNSELEHQRALEDPDAVLRDLAKIPNMEPKVMMWAMMNRLPVGRGEPGGQPFAYGLDGEPFEHELGPAAYPAVTELLRNKPKSGASSPIGRKKSKKPTTRTRSKAL